MKNCSAIVVVLIHIKARKVEPKWKIKVVNYNLLALFPRVLSIYLRISLMSPLDAAKRAELISLELTLAFRFRGSFL